MEASEFRKFGEALCGSRWKAQLARQLGLSVFTVKRYADGTREIPGPVKLAMEALVNRKREELKG